LLLAPRAVYLTKGVSGGFSLVRLAAGKRLLKVMAKAFKAAFVRREAHVIQVEVKDHHRLAAAVAG
jgi:hypothetical protein